ncbi:MAG: hypothetical protein IPJ11_12245 [Gemmatimonadetes bacterium]|nr:hypothetical protein [Gemmatimonadota bacterium]
MPRSPASQWCQCSSPRRRSTRRRRPTAPDRFAFPYLGAATASAPPSAFACPGDAALQRLCDALIATRRAELLNDKGEATKARDLLERVVGERPQWPVAWYGLGVARLQVARTGGLSRSGALHPIGVRNEAGAGYALVRALELDSTFVLAAEALAMASVPREGRRAWVSGSRCSSVWNDC